MSDADRARPRSAVKLTALALAGCLLFAGFIALGTWQVERRSWKLNLIARVNDRVHAPPVAAPGRATWPDITAKSSEYRHLRVSGHYLQGRSTLVHASSKLGYGFWVLTPLRTGRGFIVLVNRGYIPADMPSSPRYKKLTPPQGRVQITGLLRMTEPQGTLLRSNKPAQGRWYSRDVHAIAKARQLAAGDVAPYFIDADAKQHARKYPLGGLTVIHFRNAHLQYAITWYALAGLTLLGAGIVVRHEWRARREPAD